jgi:perosamine synthetase
MSKHSDRFSAESLQGRLKSTLSELFENSGQTISLHEPKFCEIDESYLLGCIKSGWVSSAGPYVTKFEETIARTVGTKHCIAVVNGTCGLQIALNVAGILPNEEVLIPSLTFVATANSVSHLGGVPHFVEASIDTLGIDPRYLRSYLNEISEFKSGQIFNRKTGRKISAIVPMHVFGHPVEMDELLDIASQFNLTLVEDAAEALGSVYKGKHCGSLGKLGVFSFNGNKIITSGGGGAIVTDDDECAAKARHITTTAKASHKWKFYHDRVAYNYRMPNLNAALGSAQLTKLEKYLIDKKQLCELYKKVFQSFNEFDLILSQDYCCSNNWLNAIILKPGYESARDPILDFLNDNNIMVRPIWEPLHTLPMYKNNPKSSLRITESLASRVICLPSSPHLIGEK